MKLPVNRALPLAALILASGCFAGGARAETPAVPAANGPAADYPMITGDPFTIGETTYTPEDKLNYDAVGYAAIGEDGAAAISGAHKTLPLPSYVEVTSLSSGRTILVRLERRGPMRNDLLIELSPGAAAQLGLTGASRAPVRVRRVNPPEPERALLRAGQQAPARMETPKPLIEVLLRKLQKQEPLAAPGAPPNPPPAAAAQAASSDPKKLPTPVPPKAVPARSVGLATPPAAPSPSQPAAPAGSLVVQVAAFSTQERADRAAKAIAGFVKRDGRYWKLRMGPFGGRADAEAALAKARAAGYSDARIQRAD